MRCNYCGVEDAQNTSRQRRHLLKCARYLQTMRDNKTPNTITDEAGTTSSNSILTTVASGAVKTMTSAEKREIDQALALAMYTANLPFSIIENGYLKQFLQKLNPAYAPASRVTFSSTFL